MYCDRWFIWPAVEALRVHKGPHYFYYFDYVGEHSYQEILAGKRLLVGENLRLTTENWNFYLGYGLFILFCFCFTSVLKIDCT